MSQQLLICVINDPARLEDILEAFIDVGVTGATVINSHGMGHLLTREGTLFAGFRTVLGGADTGNRTIFSIIESEETLQAAVRAIEDVCGGFEAPASGILFTVPVSFVRGLSPEIT
ncbi:MAG: hypothetical protein HUU25_13075 [Candidatus Sumerlaeia bacterium]|nr:hypothetical protein [Candidatus Sumerlaeia bacterium]